MLEVESSSNPSVGPIDVHQSSLYINAAEVMWNGKTGAQVAFRCNCTSTAFAPHKHGGEKGIHMRLQIDTYQVDNAAIEQSRLRHSPKSELASSTSSSSEPDNESNSISSIKNTKEAHIDHIDFANVRHIFIKNFQ